MFQDYLCSNSQTLKLKILHFAQYHKEANCPHTQKRYLNFLQVISKSSAIAVSVTTNIKLTRIKNKILPLKNYARAEDVLYVSLKGWVFQYLRIVCNRAKKSPPVTQWAICNRVLFFDFSRLSVFKMLTNIIELKYQRTKTSNQKLETHWSGRYVYDDG